MNEAANDYGDRHGALSELLRRAMGRALGVPAAFDVKGVAKVSRPDAAGRRGAGICPEANEAHGMLSPYLGTHVAWTFLDVFSKQLAHDLVAVLIWDGAGCHAGKPLRVPDNVRLLALPPYCPELNPWRTCGTTCAAAAGPTAPTPTPRPSSKPLWTAGARSALDHGTIESVCACRYR